MKKILVVEDEPALLKLLQEKITAGGYQTLEADDGEKGLLLAKKEKPDLILLDIGLPKMDGMTMLGLLRKEPEGKSVRVIILTNYEADEKIAKQVVEDQPIYYFVKSSTKLGDLMEKIKAVLAK